ncbi:MAG: hypothetical protein AB2L12_17495 [Smithellaceae bacterium]
MPQEANQNYEAVRQEVLEWMTPKNVVEEFPAIAKSMGSLAMQRNRKIGPPYYRVSSKRVVYKRSEINAYANARKVLTSS